MKTLQQHISQMKTLHSLNEFISEKLVINKDFIGFEDYEYSPEEIANEIIDKFDIQKFNLSKDEQINLNTLILLSLKKFNIKRVHGRNIYFLVPSDCINKLPEDRKKLFLNMGDIYDWPIRGKNGSRELIFNKSEKRQNSMVSDSVFSLYCWKNDFDEIEFPFYEYKNSLTLICRILT